MSLRGGCSPPLGALPTASQKTAPVSRTALSTSERGSSPSLRLLRTPIMSAGTLASSGSIPDARSTIADARSFMTTTNSTRNTPLREDATQSERKERVMNVESKTHTGHCFCGAVEIAVSGQPVGMGYCHCESCRSWSAAPVNAFTLWPPESVRITRGESKVGRFHKTDNSVRMFCTACGGHLMTEH